MDWNFAIEKNREALRRILAMLVATVEAAVIGNDRGQFTFFPQKRSAASRFALAEKSKLSPALTLPRHLHRFVLRLLRPAEAAARRLIIVAARGLVVELAPLRIAKPKTKPQSSIARNWMGIAVTLAPGQALDRVLVPSSPARPRSLSLPLFDPLKRFGVRRRYVKQRSIPRITFDFDRPREPDPVPPSPDDPLDAGRLHRRLEAIGRVLDDLPRQARRLARWQARRDAALAREGGEAARGDSFSASADLETVFPHGGKKANRPQPPRRIRRPPMRPGRPPGWRRRPDHEVYEVLNEVHSLAVWADTS